MPEKEGKKMNEGADESLGSKHFGPDGCLVKVEEGEEEKKTKSGLNWTDIMREMREEEDKKFYTHTLLPVILGFLFFLFLFFRVLRFVFS